MSYITRDSGERLEYSTGMKRDVEKGKPRFDLLLSDLPYEDQMLTRLARLLARGAEKYGERNWQLASTRDELERFGASAFRHLIQFLTNVDDGEDHGTAAIFNIQAALYVQCKLARSDEE